MVPLKNGQGTVVVVVVRVLPLVSNSVAGKVWHQ